MGKFWLFLAVFLVSLVGVSAYSCYQESANVSNQTGIDGSCVLNYSGSYSWLNPIDGVSVQYVKPKYAVGGTWVLKLQDAEYMNFTFNQSCFDYNPSGLYLAYRPIHLFFVTNNGQRLTCGGETIYINSTTSAQGDDTWFDPRNSADLSYDGNWSTWMTGGWYGSGGNSWWDSMWFDANNITLQSNITRFSFFYEEAVVWDICVPQWEQDIPVCNGYNYTISYSDLNSCGSTADLPVNNGTVLPCSSFCYQESANVSNQAGTDGSCGLEYTGSISVGGDVGNVFVNYSKPLGVTNNSVLKYRIGDLGIKYVTIPQSCLDYSNDTLRLRLYSQSAYHFTYGDYVSYIYCVNASGNVLLDTHYNSSVYIRGDLDFDNSQYIWGYDGNWSTFNTAMYYNYGFFYFDNNLSVQANPLDYYSRYQFSGFIYEEAVLWDICSPNWVNSNSVCNGVNYTILYTDSNSCGSTVGLPVNNGTVVSCIVCNPIWTPYYVPATCTLGYRTKVYSDSAYCNQTINLPFDNGTVSSCNIFTGITPNQTVKLFDNFKMLISAPVGAVVNMSLRYPNSSLDFFSTSWNGQYFESPNIYGFFAGSYVSNASSSNQSIVSNITVTDYEAVIPTQFDSVVSAGQNFTFLLQIFTDVNLTLNHSIDCVVPAGFECFVSPSLLVTGSANTTIVVTSNSSLGDGQYLGSLNVTRVLDGRVFYAELPLGIATQYGIPMVDDPLSYIDLMYSNEIRTVDYIVRNVGTYNLTNCSVVVDGTFSNKSFVNGALNFSLAPNQSAIVPVSYVQPSAGVYTGYFNVFCEATPSGFINGLTNPQYQQLFVLTYSAPFTPAGGGGGAPSVVYLSNVSTDKVFLLLNKDGSSNGYVSYSYSGDTFTKTFVVQSKVADTMNLRVACKGDFCTNVKLSKSEIALAGFGTDYFTASVVVPDTVSLDGVYSYEIVLSDSKGQSISLINEVHISSLSAWYSKFALIVDEGDKGYWFSVGGFDFPKLLLYLLLVVGVDALALVIMPKGKFYQKNVLLILTFVSLIIFGLSALIF